jgi:hypothetical protein
MKIKEKAFSGEDEDATPKIETLPKSLHTQITSSVAVSSIDLGNVKNKFEVNKAENRLGQYNRVIETFSLRHNLDSGNRVSEQGQTISKEQEIEWKKAELMFQEENLSSRMKTQDTNQLMQKLSIEDSVLKSDTTDHDNSNYNTSSAKGLKKGRSLNDSFKAFSQKSDKEMPSKKHRTVRFEESDRKSNELHNYKNQRKSDPASGK